MPTDSALPSNIPPVVYPPNPDSIGSVSPAHGLSATPTTVDLFSGCMDAFFTGPDQQAAVELLQAGGIAVRWLQRQVCCGAIDQHLGRPEDAAALQRLNVAVFAETDYPAVGAPLIVLDSGCQAQLGEHYPADFRNRVLSLTQFLAGLPLENWPWRRDPVAVAVHLPCTLRNTTREVASLSALLARIPGLRVSSFTPPANCCGAAGTAMLTQPVLADVLGQQTLAALQTVQPEFIISPNVGCSVHLRALLQNHPGPGQATATAAPKIVSPAVFLRDRLRSSCAARVRAIDIT